MGKETGGPDNLQVVRANEAAERYSKTVQRRINMRFVDPMTCRCTRCGVESAWPVSQLLGLTAHCPQCGESFSDHGLRMRRIADENVSFFDAAAITAHVEKNLRIVITDESLKLFEIGVIQPSAIWLRQPNSPIPPLLLR